jgi:hypothetical protein
MTQMPPDDPNHACGNHACGEQAEARDGRDKQRISTRTISVTAAIALS